MAKWLDDEEMKAWRGLVEVFADVEASLGGELLETHGISSGDYAVLVALSEATGHRRRMCDLALLLHLSPSGLTRRLDGLVKKGFVAREPMPDDRRVTLAVMTNKGMAKLEKAAPIHVDGVRRHLLDHLSRTQIRQLGAVLSTVQRRRLEAAAAEN
jgi:DNA-binding MarR family transcriptional regulator